MTAREDDELGEVTIARMVRAIDDEWSLESSTRIERGDNEVHRVTVATPDGPESCVLKVKHGNGDLSVEGRTMRLLAAETEVPISSVRGVVYDHPDLPVPFFLMEYLDGEQLPQHPPELPLDEGVVYARQVGRHLGEIHALEAFDGFGAIRAREYIESGGKSGAGPLAREYGLEIPEPVASWNDAYDVVAESMLDRLGDGHFADLALAIREAISERRTGLDLSGPPAIARIDHNLQNLLVDRDDQAVEAILDWGLVRTTHAEYDLACAEHGFCGTAGLDSERRRRLRSALYDGYRETNDLANDERFADRRWLYLLTFQTALMNWIQPWVGDDAALEREHRRFVDELV